jgi:hypothetical protein
MPNIVERDECCAQGGGLSAGVFDADAVNAAFVVGKEGFSDVCA